MPIKKCRQNNRNGNTREKVMKAQKWIKAHIIELFDEYCKSSSLHGLRYIREPSIPRTERFFWLGIILTCLYASWKVLIVAYQEGTYQDFGLAINAKSTPIWDIPFPAVLVCSVYPIRKSFFDIVNEVDNVKYRFYSKLVCPNKFTFKPEEYFTTIDEEYFEFIFKGAIPCRDLIVNCYWRGRKRDCCTYFSPIITEFGYCYIFNSLPGEVKYRHFSPPPGVEVIHEGEYKMWDLEHGYPRRNGNEGKLVRPLWSESDGPSGGLTFDLVDVREEWQENCSGTLNGFQLSIYTPDENIETEPIIRIPHNEHSFIKLNPSLVHAEDNLRSIPLNERECVFSDEIHLDYFNLYSQSSCQLECFIEKSLSFCGCVPFAVYRVVGVFNYNYCNESRYDCVINVLNHLLGPLSKQNGTITKCLCVPVCSWLNYDYQTTFQQIVTPATLPPWSEEYNESAVESFARVTIYFPSIQFNTVDRRRTSSLGDFLGAVGGLLGLFLGFSFMSLFEVFYFAIIRPINRICIWYIKDSAK